jgi:hypothetical protein
MPQFLRVPEANVMNCDGKRAEVDDLDAQASGISE